MKFLRYFKNALSNFGRKRHLFIRSKRQILEELKALDFSSPTHLEEAKNLFAECEVWFRRDLEDIARVLNLPCRPKFNFKDKDLVEISDVVSTMRLAALIVVAAVFDVEKGDEFLHLAVMSLKYQAAFLRCIGYDECDLPIAFKWDSARVAKDIVLEWRNSGKSRNEICNMVTNGFDELSRHIKRRVMAKYDIARLHNEAFWQYIPQSIQRVSRDLFEQEHFSEAVESAFKEINVFVKNEFLRRTNQNADGVELMHRAFSPKDPIIELSNSDCENTWKSEQQGYMDLFAGAMAALRNPKAHANVSMTKDDAVRQLMLSGLLLHRIEAFSLAKKSKLCG